MHYKSTLNAMWRVGGLAQLRPARPYMYRRGHAADTQVSHQAAQCRVPVYCSAVWTSSARQSRYHVLNGLVDHAIAPNCVKFTVGWPHEPGPEVNLFAHSNCAYYISSGALICRNYFHISMYHHAPRLAGAATVLPVQRYSAHAPNCNKSEGLTCKAEKG